MIKWLWEMLFCWHNWERFQSGALLNKDGDRIGYYEHQRCSKCKRIREKEL